MKKLMLIAAMVLISTGAFAQEKGMKCLGVGVSYGIKSHANKIAIDAKAQYNVTDYFRAEFDFKFYPKQDACHVINPNLNLQYLIPIGDSEKFFVYPTAGVGILAAYYTDFDTETMFNFQGGAGAEYHFSEKIKFFAEAIYQYAKKNEAKFDWPILSIGAAYYF
ncbi:MAG: porin family protein [Prevotella sp.]|nr:porin family protein [Prevotella sp.]